MSSNLGKTPKKAGGRFNTVATSTPTKSEPKVLKTAESSQSQAAHIQRTPVRGGALFHHASPGFHEGRTFSVSSLPPLPLALSHLASLFHCGLDE